MPQLYNQRGNYMERYFDEKIKKLGFGLMRLPRKGVAIDIEKTSKMVDLCGYV